MVFSGFEGYTRLMDAAGMITWTIVALATFAFFVFVIRDIARRDREDEEAKRRQRREYF